MESSVGVTDDGNDAIDSDYGLIGGTVTNVNDNGLISDTPAVTGG